MSKPTLTGLILEKLASIETEIKDVRQKDIPNINTKIATFQEQLNEVKEKVGTRSIIITATGGLIAVATSVAVAYFK